MLKSRFSTLSNDSSLIKLPSSLSVTDISLDLSKYVSAELLTFDHSYSEISVTNKDIYNLLRQSMLLSYINILKDLDDNSLSHNDINSIKLVIYPLNYPGITTRAESNFLELKYSLCYLSFNKEELDYMFNITSEAFKIDDLDSYLNNINHNNMDRYLNYLDKLEELIVSTINSNWKSFPWSNKYNLKDQNGIFKKTLVVSMYIESYKFAEYK